MPAAAVHDKRGRAMPTATTTAVSSLRGVSMPRAAHSRGLSATLPAALPGGALPGARPLSVHRAGADGIRALEEQRQRSYLTHTTPAKYACGWAVGLKTPTSQLLFPLPLGKESASCTMPACSGFSGAK